MTTLERFLDDLLAHHAEEAIAFRRHLHMHPELSQEEFSTTATIASRLDVAGLPVRIQPSRLGLTCDLPGGLPGGGAADGGGAAAGGDAAGATTAAPLIALRADIDALPLDDHKTVPYASTVPGVTHACGHDAHTTIVMGAGIALDALRRAAADDPELPSVGPVRLIFQPSEEKAPGGARAIIEAGGLDGVTAILGMHCDPSLPCGQVGLRVGPVTSAVDLVEIVLRGPGGHTARPHLTVNLLEAAGRVLVDLPERVAARLPSVEGHARLVFGVMSGGHAPNVIPTEARIVGTFRTMEPDVWSQAESVVQSALTEVLAGYPVEVELRYERGAPPVVNDAEVTASATRAAEAALGAAAVVEAEPSQGGEDFSFYLDHVPGTYMRLGVARPVAGPEAPPAPALHTSLFDIDERAISIGIRTLVYAVLAAQAAG